MGQVLYLHRAIPCAMARTLTTMELVPVPHVPTCDKKWVYKAVDSFAGLFDRSYTYDWWKHFSNLTNSTIFAAENLKHRSRALTQKSHGIRTRKIVLN